MARTYIVMLDINGAWSCGSDTVVPITKSPSIGKQASLHKHSFRDHPKHREWSRYAVYRGAIIDIPDRFENHYPVFQVSERNNG